MDNGSDDELPSSPLPPPPPPPSVADSPAQVALSNGGSGKTTSATARQKAKKKIHKRNQNTGNAVASSSEQQQQQHQNEQMQQPQAAEGKEGEDSGVGGQERGVASGSISDGEPGGKETAGEAERDEAATAAAAAGEYGTAAGGDTDTELSATAEADTAPPATPQGGDRGGDGGQEELTPSSAGSFGGGVLKQGGRATAVSGSEQEDEKPSEGYSSKAPPLPAPVSPDRGGVGVDGGVGRADVGGPGSGCSDGDSDVSSRPSSAEGFANVGVLSLGGPEDMALLSSVGLGPSDRNEEEVRCTIVALPGKIMARGGWGSPCR